MDLSQFENKFNETVQKLRTIWRETGLPSDEQEKSINLLRAEVFNVSVGMNQMVQSGIIGLYCSEYSSNTHNLTIR